MKYFCRLNKSGFFFEYVTEEVFMSRKFALSECGTKNRYTDDYVTVSPDGDVHMNITSIKRHELGWLCRMLSVPAQMGSGAEIYTEPRMVPMKKGRTTYLLEVATGVKWTKR